MDPGVANVLARLVEGQQHALGNELVGSYLFGSAVTGAFDPGISDVDTVAVLRADLTPAQLAALQQLHLDIVEEMPEWENRVEAVYLPSQALATFRTKHRRRRASPRASRSTRSRSTEVGDRLVPAPRSRHRAGRAFPWRPSCRSSRRTSTSKPCVSTCSVGRIWTMSP